MAELDTDEIDTADLPVVHRVGDTVVMQARDFDDLLARLLVAEGKHGRSWMRP